MGTLTFKGTTTLVNSKIQSLKEERNADKLRNTYDEIVNELLSEREQAIRIAQAYKEEYEKVHIDDKDIEYLHNTLERVISLLSSFTNVEDGKEDSMKQLVALLNKDTLKTMQLLGFNQRLQTFKNYFLDVFFVSKNQSSPQNSPHIHPINFLNYEKQYHLQSD